MRITSLTPPQMALLASCTDIGWEGAEPDDFADEGDIDQVGVVSVMNHGSVEDYTDTGTQIHIIHANSLELDLIQRGLSALLSDYEGTSGLSASEATKIQEMLPHLHTAS